MGWQDVCTQIIMQNLNLVGPSTNSFSGSCRSSRFEKSLWSCRRWRFRLPGGCGEQQRMWVLLWMLENQKWDVFQGGGVPVTSPRLYSAGHTDDLRLALIYLQHKYPHAPLLGLGFSLGANLMTRYVAEEGEASRLSSVCCLSSVSRVHFSHESKI